VDEGGDGSFISLDLIILEYPTYPPATTTTPIISKIMKSDGTDDPVVEGAGVVIVVAVIGTVVGVVATVVGTDVVIVAGVCVVVGNVPVDIVREVDGDVL